VSIFGGYSWRDEKRILKYLRNLKYIAVNKQNVAPFAGAEPPDGVARPCNDQARPSAAECNSDATKRNTAQLGADDCFNW